jgi:hypothetical protein
LQHLPAETCKCVSSGRFTVGAGSPNGAANPISGCFVLSSRTDEAEEVSGKSALQSHPKKRSAGRGSSCQEALEPRTVRNKGFRRGQNCAGQEIITRRSQARAAADKLLPPSVRKGFEGADHEWIVSLVIPKNPEEAAGYSVNKKAVANSMNHMRRYQANSILINMAFPRRALPALDEGELIYSLSGNF